MNDRLAVLPQYLLPKQALTAIAGRFAPGGGRGEGVDVQQAGCGAAGESEGGEGEQAGGERERRVFSRCHRSGATCESRYESRIHQWHEHRQFDLIFVVGCEDGRDSIWRGDV